MIRSRIGIRVVGRKGLVKRVHWLKSRQLDVAYKIWKAQAKWFPEIFSDKNLLRGILARKDFSTILARGNPQLQSLAYSNYGCRIKLIVELCLSIEYILRVYCLTIFGLKSPDVTFLKTSAYMSNRAVILNIQKSRIWRIKFKSTSVTRRPSLVLERAGVRDASGQAT